MPAPWGAVDGGLAITILGFSADGVTASGAAAAIAEERADDAVLTALTPCCVAGVEALGVARNRKSNAGQWRPERVGKLAGGHC